MQRCRHRSSGRAGAGAGSMMGFVHRLVHLLQPCLCLVAFLAKSCKREWSRRAGEAPAGQIANQESGLRFAARLWRSVPPLLRNRGAQPFFLDLPCACFILSRPALWIRTVPHSTPIASGSGTALWRQCKGTAAGLWWWEATDATECMQTDTSSPAQQNTHCAGMPPMLAHAAAAAQPT